MNTDEIGGIPQQEESSYIPESVINRKDLLDTGLKNVKGRRIALIISITVLLLILIITPVLLYKYTSLLNVFKKPERQHSSRCS